MIEPLAIYSLPGTPHFYRVRGQAEVINSVDVFQKPGFLFAPFDASSEPIYRIAGRPEKFTLDSQDSVNWGKKPGTAHRTDRLMYQDMFRQGLEAIESGAVDKIVLSAREIDDTPIFSINKFLQKLRDSYPSAFVFLFYIPGKECWLGASPELLLDTAYPFQRTVALAGTLKNAPKLDHWPGKERQEHRYVEQYVEEVLEGRDYRKEGPQPVSAGPVFHLKSTYFINIQGQPVNPFDLHPGPALSGYPVKASIRKILAIEDSPRRYYTGFLGPVWEEGHSQFYINLRCLEMREHFNILYAGGGLTHDSDLEAEWMEIQDKLTTLRSKIQKGEKIP